VANLPGLPADQIGAALAGAMRPVADAVRGVTDALRAVVPGFESLYQTVRQFGDWLRSNTSQMTAQLGEVVRAFGAVASVAPKVAAAAGVLGSLISGVVAKANPAVAQQFTLALNDTLAVIGQALVPVLRVLTRLMRSFGDTLQSFAGGVGEALASILDSLMPLFQVFLDVFARAGELVAGVLQFVAPLVKIAAEGIRTVFEWIGKAVRYLLDLIGIEVSESRVRPGSSVGAAVRQAGVSSVSGVIQQAQISALQLGNASTSYGKMTADNTAQLIVRADSIVGKIEWMVRNIEQMPRLIGDAVADAVNPFSTGPGGPFSMSGAVPGGGLVGAMVRKPTPEAGSLGVPGGGLLGGMVRRDGGGTVPGG